MQNDTSNASQTDNPQDAGASTGASNGADFQQTAPSNLLNEGSQDLGVQEVSSQSSASVNGGFDWTPWLIGLGLIVLVAALVMVVRSFADDAEEEPVPTPKKPAAAKKPAATTKKTAKTKSGKPVKRSKKPARKRR